MKNIEIKNIYSPLKTIDIFYTLNLTNYFNRDSSNNFISKIFNIFLW